jgi:hypothetical protein
MVVERSLCMINFFGLCLYIDENLWKCAIKIQVKPRYAPQTGVW